MLGWRRGGAEEVVFGVVLGILWRARARALAFVVILWCFGDGGLCLSYVCYGIDLCDGCVLHLGLCACVALGSHIRGDLGVGGGWWEGGRGVVGGWFGGWLWGWWG